MQNRNEFFFLCLPEKKCEKKNKRQHTILLNSIYCVRFVSFHFTRIRAAVMERVWDAVHKTAISRANQKQNADDIIQQTLINSIFFIQTHSLAHTLHNHFDVRIVQLDGDKLMLNILHLIRIYRVPFEINTNIEKTHTHTYKYRCAHHRLFQNFQLEKTY